MISWTVDQLSPEFLINIQEFNCFVMRLLLQELMTTVFRILYRAATFILEQNLSDGFDLAFVTRSTTEQDPKNGTEPGPVDLEELYSVEECPTGEILDPL